MGIIAKSDESKQRKLPSSGLHKAVCCDVHDLGYEETPWGDKHKILIVWELDEDHPDFEGPHRVNKKYTNSLHEKANLSQDLESWFGKSFSKDQRKKGFDLEKLIGRSALVNIVHSDTDSGMWANMKAILPLPKDQEPLEISSGYVRIKDRAEQDGSNNGREEPAKEEPEYDDNFGAKQDEDDLPF